MEDYWPAGQPTSPSKALQGLHICPGATPTKHASGSSGQEVGRDKKHTPSKIGTLGKVPREIRDQIYHHLLNKTYCAKLRQKTIDEEGSSHRLQLPVFAFSNDDQAGPSDPFNFDLDLFDAPTHPNFIPGAPSLTDTVAPWASNPRDIRGRRVLPGLPPEHLRYRLDMGEWSETVTILGTSKQFYRETSPILYGKSLILFYLSAPRQVNLFLPALAYLRHVELYIDLIAAQRLGDEPYYQSSTFTGNIGILGALVSNTPRKHCLIHIDCCEKIPCNFGVFAMMVYELKCFETLVLQFTPIYKEKRYRHLYETAAYKASTLKLHDFNMKQLKTFEEGLVANLGPCEEEFDREDGYRLTVHPAPYFKANPKAREFSSPQDIAIAAWTRELHDLDLIESGVAGI